MGRRLLGVFPGSSYPLLIFGAPSEKFAVQYARAHHYNILYFRFVVAHILWTRKQFKPHVQLTKHLQSGVLRRGQGPPFPPVST